MFFSDPIKKWKPWIERHARTAYKPIVQEGHGADAGSRFNGAPFLVGGEDWPACPTCAKPMHLFVQLDLDALPGDYAGKFGSGLLQLFYCVQECETEALADGWDPANTQSKLVRVVPQGAAGAIAAPHDTGLEAEPQTITNWSPHREGCNSEEAEEHGVKNEYERKPPSHRVRVTCPELKIDTGWIDADTGIRLDEAVFCPSGGDKLGGWPMWVQSVEYPNCPQCSTRMQLVFQIDSEDHVPFMFGDVGTGHITQCPTHKDAVAFGWACT